MMSEDEVSTVRTLQDYRKAISNLVQKHNGRVVDSPGDNLMAEFASVVDAVECAVEIQTALNEKNDELPENRKMMFRIGINLGDVIVEDGRIYGDGVNIAARIESLAEPGGICISGEAYDQVEKKLHLEYEFLGEKTAKNIKGPIRVYKIPIMAKEPFSDPFIDLSIPTDKPSIAVLPFVNMSGDPEQEYFSDGITEEIITSLSKVPGLLVIARNSTFTYKGKAVDIKQVGKELGVKYVLEGSVRKAGNFIRVTAQLINAASGNHIWADRYDRELKDIFKLQDDLTLNILKELDVMLYHSERARLKIKGTNNLEAYLKWWQGVEYLSRSNKNDNVIARQIFEEVIQLDQYFSRGYTNL
jgi:adenylate cyclase